MERGGSKCLGDIQVVHGVFCDISLSQSYSFFSKHKPSAYRSPSGLGLGRSGTTGLGPTLASRLPDRHRCVNLLLKSLDSPGRKLPSGRTRICLKRLGHRFGILTAARRGVRHTVGRQCRRSLTHLTTLRGSLAASRALTRSDRTAHSLVELKTQHLKAIRSASSSCSIHLSV